MGIKTIFEILDAWHTERKRHDDKTFKQWLKHVGGLWTSTEEWKKIGRLETWKPVVEDTGKGIAQNVYNKSSHCNNINNTSKFRNKIRMKKNMANNNLSLYIV